MAPHSLPPDYSGLPLPPLSLTARPASNADQLAEAASKISLLSPEQFKPAPTKIKPDLVIEESTCNGRMTQQEDSQPDSDNQEDLEMLDLELAPQAKLDCVVRKLETVSESGNSSPSF